MRIHRAQMRCVVGVLLLGLGFTNEALAQTGPSAAEIGAYMGLHAAAARGDRAGAGAAGRPR